MPFPRPTLTALRAQAMQDVTASDLPNADGFMRRAALRVLAWVQASLGYLHYAYLDWISLQSTPFTATGEYLEGWAALAPTPVLREAPTPASGPASWPSVYATPPAVTDLPAGTVCTRSDGAQFATLADAMVSSGGTVTTTVQALVAGSNGNTDSGATLTLGSALAGIVSTGAATGPITGGADLELDGPMQTRMLESYGAPPHGGNQADYVTWALAVTGVTRAWCAPGGAGNGRGPFHDGRRRGHAWRLSAGLERRRHAGGPLRGGVGRSARGGELYLPAAPCDPIVYALAPQAATHVFTIAGLSAISSAQKALVSAALTTLFLQKDTPLGTTSIEQSDCAGAITAIDGLPSFAITTPSSWPQALGSFSLSEQ